MSQDGAFFVRSFGDLPSGAAGLSWRLGGTQGAISMSAGRLAAAEDPGSSGEAAGGWSFRAEWGSDPLEGSAVFRQVAVETRDGATIACSASGPAGLAGHGEESTSGFLRAGGDDAQYEESLISTQYGADGDPTRFGLELWPPDADQASRAAAIRVSGNLIGGARRGPVWGGFFRCHADGAEGLGTYLLWRG